MAASLAGRVERFALVAAEQDQVAGLLRFFPKRYARPRYGAWDRHAHRQDSGDDVLWLGAAAVDMRGYEDRIAIHLLGHVVDEARRLGFWCLQALAWSDVPAYALWGQSFPWMVYEAAGFCRIADTDGSGLRTLPDMIAGHHGGIVQELINTQLEHSGLTMAAADSFAVVEFGAAVIRDLSDPAVGDVLARHGRYWRNGQSEPAPGPATATFPPAANGDGRPMFQLSLAAPLVDTADPHPLAPPSPLDGNAFRERVERDFDDHGLLDGDYFRVVGTGVASEVFVCCRIMVRAGTHWAENCFTDFHQLDYYRVRDTIWSVASSTTPGEPWTGSAPTATPLVAAPSVAPWTWRRP